MKRYILLTFALISILVTAYFIDSYNKVADLNSGGLRIGLTIGNNEENFKSKHTQNQYKHLGLRVKTFNNYTTSNKIVGVPDLIFSIDANIDTSNLYFTLRKNSSLVVETSNFDEINNYLQFNKEDNNYEVTVELEYSFRFIKGYYQEKFLIDIDYPMEVILNKTSVSKGDFITITTKNRSDGDFIETTSDLNKLSLEFYQDGEELLGFLPIDYKEELGNHCINLNSKCYQFEIVDKQFNEVHFNIDNSTLKRTSSDEAYKQYYQALNQAYEENTETIMYEDKFIIPTEGRLSSDFLDTRYINESKTPSSYHQGIDIANKEGSKIYAVASGKVVLSQDLTVSGNSIIIYHGANLYSVYYHLSELKVDVGEKITQGQLIGLMGTTGMSTGSHLHFAMRIGSTYIDPWIFIKEANDGSIFEK